MKKKLLTGVALATLVVGGLMTARQAPQSALSDLQMENLETLTANEGSVPTLNCVVSPEDICSILAQDALGRWGWYHISGLVHI